MERGHRGREGHRRERLDTRIVPLAIVPIGEEHVVAVVGAEGRILSQLFGEARVGGASDGYGCGHGANKSTGKVRRGKGTNWRGGAVARAPVRGLSNQGLTETPVPVTGNRRLK